MLSMKANEKTKMQILVKMMLKKVDANHAMWRTGVGQTPSAIFPRKIYQVTSNFKIRFVEVSIVVIDIYLLDP